MPRFPSREWAEEFCRQLNSSQGYRRSARGWVWPMLFKIVLEGGESKGLVARLNNGVCEGVEWYEDASEADAPFILSGTLRDWLDVIEGKVGPIMAITRGKLKLEKGDVKKILRYPLAALEMVKAAQRVPAE